MARVVVPLILLASLVLAGCIGGTPPIDPETPPAQDGRDDVVIVAVFDWQLNPYHWDFLAAHMPQHNDDDPTTDLPLHEDPSTWIRGFPEPSAFASYDSLDLTLTPDDPDAVPADLYEKDKDEWAKMRQSGADGIHFRYIPGTKVIGFISTTENDGFATTSHGLGASSVSVGNHYGTCPSCLLLFVGPPSAAMEDWVRQQDWIDATTHSYEASTTGVARDNIRDCDNAHRKAAAERGQQIFWAAGNGLLNTFTIPQTTLVNCQKAPDWTVAVGAIHPETHASYIGHGKPVHVASIGSGYPRAGGGTVTAEGTFSGTSNATPVTAGLYAQALYELRRAASESERIQQDGVILKTTPGCGEADPDCPLADGILTAHELRQALFRAAQPTDAFMHVVAAPVPGVGAREAEIWTEGHGSFLGHLGDPQAEVQRIVDHATGNLAHTSDPDVDAWMAAFSWCVQQVWGTWDHGAWQAGDTLPAADPAWPQRSWMSSELCPSTVKAILGRV